MVLGQEMGSYCIKKLAGDIFDFTDQESTAESSYSSKKYQAIMRFQHQLVAAALVLSAFYFTIGDCDIQSYNQHRLSEKNQVLLDPSADYGKIVHACCLLLLKYSLVILC